MDVSFWEKIPLEKMTETQWESLCDGCGQCCLHKLEDDRTEAVDYTYLHCDLLDADSCRCQDYENRQNKVPDCIKLTPECISEHSHWLPRSCAYRRLAEGRALAWWHPLISGNQSSVHDAGVSVRGKTVPVQNVPEEAHEQCIIKWVD